MSEDRQILMARSFVFLLIAAFVSTFGYFLFYAPMSRNYEACGTITLCAAVIPTTIERDGFTYIREDVAFTNGAKKQ